MGACSLSFVAFFLHLSVCIMDNIEKFQKKSSKLCSKCGRKNGFRPNGGSYRTDSDHELCTRCWRSIYTSTLTEE